MTGARISGSVTRKGQRKVFAKDLSLPLRTHFLPALTFKGAPQSWICTGAPVMQHPSPASPLCHPPPPFIVLCHPPIPPDRPPHLAAQAAP